MDIGRSFKFMFEDEKWITKILIGGLLGLVPILNFVIYGYQLDVIKNVSQDQELPLPDWDDFGGKFVRGLMVVIASFIYSLPLIVLWVIGVIIMAIAGGAAGSSSDEAAGAAGGIAGLCMLALYCVTFIYSIIVYGFIMLPGVMRYAETGEFGAFFKFGDNLRLATSNLGGYIIMLLVVVLAGIVAEIVGTIACVIGILFTMFWALLVSGHLFGQYWKERKSAESF